MSDKSLLITLPDHDDTVAYLSTWSGAVIKAADERGVKKFILPGKKANRKSFESYVKSNNPNFVMFNGHGSVEEVRGQDDECLVKCNDNEALLNGKIIYARSCNSLVALGKSCVKKGAKAYIGYRSKFFLPVKTDRMTTPLRDEFCKPFIECANVIPISIIEGDSVGEACEKSRVHYMKEIKFLYGSGAPEAPHIATFLKWNMEFEGFEGKADATI